MEEFFQFRYAFRNCAGEDFFEICEFQQSPVRPHDFVSAVAEEEQPRRAGETTLMALVFRVRHDTHRTTNGRQRLRFAALFSCTAHQNWWWVPGAGIAQRSCRAVVDAIPDGEIETVLIFHLESLIQRAQYLFRPTEIGVLQGAGPQRIRYRD